MRGQSVYYNAITKLICVTHIQGCATFQSFILVLYVGLLVVLVDNISFSIKNILIFYGKIKSALQESVHILAVGRRFNRLLQDHCCTTRMGFGWYRVEATTTRIRGNTRIPNNNEDILKDTKQKIMIGTSKHKVDRLDLEITEWFILILISN